MHTIITSGQSSPEILRGIGGDNTLTNASEIDRIPVSIRSNCRTEIVSLEQVLQPSKEHR